MEDQAKDPKKVSSLKEQAQKGNPEAISILMNRSFQRRGVNASVRLHEDCLQILLESVKVPNQAVYVSMVLTGLQNLAIANINVLEIYGKQTSSEIPRWSHKIDLTIDTQEIVPEILPADQQNLITETKDSQEVLSTDSKPLIKESANKSDWNKKSNLRIRLITQLSGRLNLRAAIYGFLLDIISSEATVFFFTSIATVLLTIQGKSPYQMQSEFSSNLFLIIYLCIGLTFSCAGGFFSAHWAKQNEIFNAALTGTISTSLGILMHYTNPSSTPSWFFTTALYLTIPVAIAGGYLRKISFKKQTLRA
ncbi:hypothetical protein APA_420 [Pseudanabaena sp. lw0831]|uniref:hypothetical protein n=1 Tax=Pseudanabaena sp. lw0831 TaxID=1357935 RepID=UPI001914ECCD|nr:hypothetical protein [Pseudanabaena sp. lw0831]GBO52751.1 hypothetical protein APA_420 [Pseudanabaena sp. lw0831]